MSNFYQSDQSPESEIMSAITKKTPGARFMYWWHSISSPSPPPKNATVPQRERHRRARAVSVVILSFLPPILIALPTTIHMVNPWTFPICLTIAISLIVALFFNRVGFILTAGLFIVLTFQAVVMAYLLTTPLLNASALQVYDLFDLVIILALAILPIRTIWFFTIFDCGFIVLDLIYQPRTEAFTQLINHEQLVSLLVRPLAIILVLSSISTYLIINITKAVSQSYEAEFVANLEHAAAQQNEMEAQAKQELEASIQQIVQAYTDTINGRTKERIPYPKAKVLWPLVGIQNTLWTRLQRFQRQEQELSQLQEDITKYNEMLQLFAHSPEKPLIPYQTRTMLAPLSHSMSKVHGEMLNRLMRRTRRPGTDIL